jgi:hypothetical protein
MTCDVSAGLGAKSRSAAGHRRWSVGALSLHNASNGVGKRFSWERGRHSADTVCLWLGRRSSPPTDMPPIGNAKASRERRNPAAHRSPALIGLIASGRDRPRRSCEASRLVCPRCVGSTLSSELLVKQSHVGLARAYRLKLCVQMLSASAVPSRVGATLA